MLVFGVPLEAAVTNPLAFTVIFALVNAPIPALTVAKVVVIAVVPVPVTSPDKVIVSLPCKYLPSKSTVTLLWFDTVPVKTPSLVLKVKAVKKSLAVTGLLSIHLTLVPVDDNICVFDPALLLISLKGPETLIPPKKLTGIVVVAPKVVTLCKVCPPTIGEIISTKLCTVKLTVGLFLGESGSNSLKVTVPISRSSR